MVKGRQHLASLCLSLYSLCKKPRDEVFVDVFNGFETLMPFTQNAGLSVLLENANFFAMALAYLDPVWSPDVGVMSVAMISNMLQRSYKLFSYTHAQIMPILPVGYTKQEDWRD